MPVGELLRRHREYVVLGAVVIVMVGVAYAARTTGHWWGDDWALYVRQAESLLERTSSAVIDDNRFSVEQSVGTEFSPPVYPWGFPLLLAPFVAMLGRDLDRLMLVEVVSFGWFLVMWFRLARPRTGTVAALVGTVVLAMSPQYLRWTELIQSELPFMAVAGTALVVLDRQRVRASLVARGAPWWPLVGVGVAAAAAFTMRREGLAMVPAVATAQLAALVAWWRRDVRSDWRSVRWRPLIGRLAVPHLAWLATIGLVQVILPSTLVPSYRGTGLGNVVEFASDHLGHVAESLGLKDVPTETPTVLGNAVLGWLAVAAFVALLVVGIVWSVWRRPVPDLPLVAFLVVVFLIGGSFRFPGTRYVAMVGPIALVFALAGLRRLVELVRPLAAARRTQLVIALVLLPLVAANVWRAGELVSSARDFERAGQVEWGPDAPASVQMFDAVERFTDPDDVVGFFKARAMTLLTDRRALQVGGQWKLDPVADRLDAVVLESSDTQFDVAVADPDRFRQLWTNGRFTLFAVSPSPN